MIRPFITGLIFLALASPALAQPEGPDEIVLNALVQSDYRELRQRHDVATGYVQLLARSQLASLDGDLETALATAEEALEEAPAEARALVLLRLSSALTDTGDYERAEALLRSGLQDSPQSHGVRVSLGSLLVQRGQRDQAEVLVRPMAAFFNQGLITSAADLVHLSLGMQLLESWDDANHAMRRAVEVSRSDALVLWRWADLLSSKYNAPDAIRTYEEALEAAQDHVPSLVGLARVKMRMSHDGVESRALLARAERWAPEYPGLLLTRAEMSIYDGDFPGAKALAQRVLSRRPNHVEALRYLAVTSYLLDQSKAFEEAVAELHKRAVADAGVFVLAARFANLVHRYDDVVLLSERALALDLDQPSALLELGIGLSRTGEETRALEVFRRAFSRDPYNVRAFNFVELYEKMLPEYEFVDFDGFLLRAHPVELPQLRILVPPRVQEALALFDKKYEFRLDDYLAVEYFHRHDIFSVRTVGLPHIVPHGICFGRVVASRSPSEANFNWAQVLWHELAHVYHLQVSNSRVPRWFTEGLAEYETNVKDPSWSRHHHFELAQAKMGGRLRSIRDLDRGFTHAGSINEMLSAYFHSSLLIHYIVETFGWDVIPAMLRAWGEKKSTTDVFRTVLGKRIVEVDQGFESYLGTFLSGFRRQVSFDLQPGDIDELEAQALANPQDGWTWVQIAVTRSAQGNAEGSRQAWDRANEVAGDDARVLLALAWRQASMGRMRQAYELGERVLALHVDGYQLRILLGESGLAIDKFEEAYIHFKAATVLHPHDGSSFRKLAELADRVGEPEEAARARARVFELDSHDPRIARRAFEESRSLGDTKGAVASARRWVDISPYDARAQQALATVVAASFPEEAERSFRIWQELRPHERRRIALEAVTVFAEAGDSARTQQWSTTAMEEGATQQDVEEAIKRGST